MLELTIYGIPLAKQSARFCVRPGKHGGQYVHSYQPKKIKDHEKNVRAQIVNQLPDGFTPIQGPIVIEGLTYVFPILKSMSKKIKALAENEYTIVYKDTQPDLNDNLNKGLFDAMEGIVFNNDSQIVLMSNVKKIYGSKPMIHIRLRPITQVEYVEQSNSTI
jgi:Holliday junction resolvase RusA-like endonuclease